MWSIQALTLTFIGLVSAALVVRKLREPINIVHIRVSARDLFARPVTCTEVYTVLSCSLTTLSCLP